MTSDGGGQTFWDHLDILRGVIIRIVLVSVLCSIVAFIFKDEVFDIIFAPKSPHFITYHLINDLCSRLNLPLLENFNVQLINTGLAQQFIIHLKTAFCIGIICASPYIVYELFSFIAPGLYSEERRYTIRILLSAYLMFAVGLLFSYFIVFPLTFRFLGTYQVNHDITNLISLDSYMSTLIIMSLSMGIVFEIPVLSWILAKMGLLKKDFMKRYRRHSIVVILFIAAVITPTSDIFTLLLVALPMYILYEFSILLVKSATDEKYEITVSDSMEV